MKKITVFFVAIILCINSFSVCFAKTDAQTPSALQDEYVENGGFLSSLGILSEDMSANIYSDYAVRKKALAYILDLMNVDYDAGSLAEVAVRYGLISKESELRPDAKLSVKDAVILMINLLGYTPYAEANGSVPYGYMQVAKKIDLLDGVDTSGTFITYGDFCRLIVNSLETEVYSVSKISDNPGSSFEVAGTDENLLQHNFDYDIIEGIVSENNISTLYMSAENDKGTLRIGENVYYAPDSRYSDLLGHNVKLYIDKNDNVLYATPYESTQIVIDSRDFESCENGKVKYYSGNKAVTKRIDNSPHIIYNGVAYNGYTSKDLNEFEGEMVLIDNDRDNTYEVVKVNNYVTGVLKTVNVFDKAVAFDFPENIAYKCSDLSDEQISVVLPDGSDVPFTYMLDKDVVSVLQSKSGSSIIFKVSRNTVDGMLESIGKDTVTVNGQKYEYTDEMKSKIKNFEIGTTFVFALDFKGRIAGVLDERNSKYKFGYIIKTKTFGSFSDNSKVKLLDEDGEILIYDFADKVKIDGNTYSKGSAAAALVDPSTGSERQIVKYGVLNGKVNVIDTANVGTGGRLDNLKTKKYDQFPSSKYRKYTNGNTTVYGNIGGVGIITEDVTPVFRVPKIIASNPDYVFPDRYYKVYKSFGGDEAEIIKKKGDCVEFVNPNDFMLSEALVYYNTVTVSEVENAPIGGKQTAPEKVMNNNTPVVVSSIAKIIDENGDDAYRLYCTKHPMCATDLQGLWNDSNLAQFSSFDLPKDKENLLWKNVYDSDGNIIEGQHMFLEAGDIVQFTTEYGELRGSYVIYDTNLTPMQNANKLKSYTYGSALGFTFGIPYSNDVRFVKLCTTYDTSTNSIVVSEDKAIVFVNADKCLDISLSDPESCSIETIASAARSYDVYGDDAGYMLVISYTAKIKAVFCIHK